MKLNCIPALGVRARRVTIDKVGTFAVVGGFIGETTARLAFCLGWELPIGWLDGMWAGAGTCILLAIVTEAARRTDADRRGPSLETGGLKAR